MLVYEISEINKTFRTPENWDEITLSQYAEFIEAVTALTDKLKADDKSESGFYEIVLSYRSEFNRIIRAFTGLNEKTINQVNAEDIYSVYVQLTTFLSAPEFKPIKRFKFKNKYYYLPESAKDYFGNEIEMGKATFGEVVEALQIRNLNDSFKNNKFSALPYQIAILCRPKNEAYDDQKVADRAKMFGGLPMSVVWNISFFLMKPQINYLNRFLKSLEAKPTAKPV